MKVLDRDRLIISEAVARKTFTEDEIYELGYIWSETVNTRMADIYNKLHDMIKDENASKSDMMFLVHNLVDHRERFDNAITLISMRRILRVNDNDDEQTKKEKKFIFADLFKDVYNSINHNSSIGPLYIK